MSDANRPHNQPHFDRSIFDSLHQLIEDDINDLLDLFFEIGPELTDKIVSASNSNNIDELNIAAHTLKSNSAQLGALRLSEICNDLELLARSGNIESSLPLALLVQSEMNELIIVLKKIRA